MSVCTSKAGPPPHLRREEGDVGEGAGARQEGVLDGTHHKHHGLATAGRGAGTQGRAKVSMRSNRQYTGGPAAEDGRAVAGHQ